MRVKGVMPPRSTYISPTARGPKPEHNMAMQEVIDRIYITLGAAPSSNLQRRDYWIKVDQTLADKFANGHLHSWGRLSNRKALQPIYPNQWADGEFDHKRGSLQVQESYADISEYSDLHFCRREIDKIWPER